MSFVSYAQNFEDVMLWRALKHVRHGFYIDVGANDPTNDSVTKSFYDQGWSGINIEPLNSHHADLQQERPRDINLQCAAGEICGEIELWECDVRGWATADKSVVALHEKNGHLGVLHKVPVLPLSEICNANVKGEIHFLKIDVEGFEKAVLEGMDFSHFRPWVLVVEATRPNSTEEVYEEWEDIVLSNNYLFAYTDRLNRFYVASEHSELLDALHYPPNIFDDFIRVEQWTAVLCMQQAEAKAEKAAAKLTERKQEIDELQVLLTERTTQQQVLDANLQKNKDERKQEVDKLQVSLTEKTRQQQGLDASLQETTAECERLTKELQTVHNSKSWRITWPRRKLMQFFKWLLRLPIRLTLWLIHLPKRTVRWLMVKMISSVIKHPAVKVRAMNWLHNYPNFKEKLRRLAQARGLISMQVVSSIIPIQPILKSTELTPTARHIYHSLKAAIENTNKESR